MLFKQIQIIPIFIPNQISSPNITNCPKELIYYSHPKKMFALISNFLFLILMFGGNNNFHCDPVPEPHCYEFGGFCFFFPYVKLNPIVNQSVARAICQTNGGDLPSIHSQEECDFFEQEVINLPFKYWLGLELEFLNEEPDSPVAAISNTDGTPVDFANPMDTGFVFGSEPWANYMDAEVTDEPNNFLLSTEPYCTDIKQQPHFPAGWETQWCGALLRVVCKKPAP